MKRILIFGSNGMLAKDIINQLQGKYSLSLSDLNTDILCNITDEIDVLHTIQITNPDLIINCAAYTNVDESEIGTKALEVNYKGVENIAKACNLLSIVLFHISTDYVFDGNSNIPYTNEDLENPINAYGFSKLCGERAIRQFSDLEYVIIRTSWLYGKYGNCFPKIISRKLLRGENIKVVNDQIGIPTSTLNLAENIEKLIDKYPINDVVHCVGDTEMSWYEFALKIRKFLIDNFPTLKIGKVLPCNSDEYKTKAKRPKNSVLENTNECKSYSSINLDFLIDEIKVDEN